MAEELADAVRGLQLGDPVTSIVCIDTEGNSRTGLRQVAAVLSTDPDVFFFDTVTPLRSAEGLAPSDAKRTWAHVGPRFWSWISNMGDRVVLSGHNIRAHDRPLLVAETQKQCPHALKGLEGRLFIADTLDATRKAIPFEELRDRRQQCVYRHLFGADPLQKHTALIDARSNAAIAAHPRIHEKLVDETLWTPWFQIPSKGRQAALKNRKAALT